MQLGSRMSRVAGLGPSHDGHAMLAGHRERKQFTIVNKWCLLVSGLETLWLPPYLHNKGVRGEKGISRL